MVKTTLLKLFTYANIMFSGQGLRVGKKLNALFIYAAVYYCENVWYFYFLLKYYGKIEKEKENQPSQSNICSWLPLRSSYTYMFYTLFFSI